MRHSFNIFTHPGRGTDIELNFGPQVDSGPWCLVHVPVTLPQLRTEMKGVFHRSVAPLALRER